MNDQALLGVIISGVDVSSEYMMSMPLQELLNLPAQDDVFR